MNKPSIRRSQLITTFGPGALVNLVTGSYIGMNTDLWPRDSFEDKVYDDRLQKRLGKKFFVQPPSKESNEAGLPYRRFPRWFFCSHNKCRLLQPYEKWEERNPRSYNSSPLICPDHRIPLVPMNFLVACHKGHIDDFPWSEWAHKFNKDCTRTAPLKYLKSGSGAGLGGMVIQCAGCDSKKDMRGSFSPEAFGGLSCNGVRPWTGKDEASICGKRLVTIQRGGSNVYFPKIVSSIAIPSSYNNLIEEIKRTDSWEQLSSLTSMQSDFMTKEIKDAIKETIVAEIAKELEKDPAEIRKFMEKYTENSEETKEERSDEDYLFDEYQAFHGKYNASEGSSRDFKVEDATSGYDYDKFGIKSVYMVKAIREVRALIGFSRLKPLDQDEETGNEENTEKAHLVPISEKPLNWLPAVEVRGEGIFMTFEEEKLTDWSLQPSVVTRTERINKHYKKSCEKRDLPFVAISSKKIFLHTFAHILIRQLSFECGYASASLRERIYCDNDGPNKMQGILIYTAAGDADGTLGGLVRQAKIDRFPKTLMSALSNSTWCSNDPLCLESSGQGFESLNLAACYACCLLPETSCELFNKFLDRAMVVGSPEDTSVSFFKPLLSKLTDI